MEKTVYEVMNPFILEPGKVVHCPSQYLQRFMVLIRLLFRYLFIKMMSFMDSNSSFLKRKMRLPRTAHHNDAPQISVKGTELIIKGESFIYIYQLAKAAFTSVKINQKELLERPTQFSIWRAPTDNDRNLVNKWKAAGYAEMSLEIRKKTGNS